MAKFRLVHTSFWDDPTVVEEMTAEDKYFFLYLLTNERTTQIGIYQTSKKQIAFDIGYSIESVGALMQRFTEHHKIIKYNPDTREIAIRNWGKYNLVRGGKPILDCVKSELNKVKDNSLIKYVGENIPNSSIRNVYESYYVTSNDTCDDTPCENEEKREESSSTKASYVTYHDSSTISGQEKEKEKEKEEEKEEEEQQEKESRRASVVNQDLASIYKFFESNIAPLTPFVGEELDYMVKENASDLVLEALKISVRKNKATIPFIEGILRNWRRTNIKSLHDLKMHEKRSENINGTDQGTTTVGNVELGF